MGISSSNLKHAAPAHSRSKLEGGRSTTPSSNVQMDRPAHSRSKLEGARRSTSNVMREMDKPAHSRSKLDRPGANSPAGPASTMPSPWRLDPSHTRDETRPPVASPNPDPYDCEITRSERANGCQIIEVHYPTCTTYEGRKLMLFAPGVTLAQIAGQGAIDPHFTNDSAYHHPIARFEPTARGWELARASARSIG